MGDLGTSIGAAAVISFVIAFLKNQHWFPYLTAETEKLNRYVAIGLSGLAALGINATFDHSHGVLTITGLTLTSIVTAGWLWLKQFAITHGWFKATGSTDQIVGLLKQLVAAKEAQKQG